MKRTIFKQALLEVSRLPEEHRIINKEGVRPNLQKQKYIKYITKINEEEFEVVFKSRLNLKLSENAELELYHKSDEEMEDKYNTLINQGYIEIN